jgi:hypothetical protein
MMLNYYKVKYIVSELFIIYWMFDYSLVISMTSENLLLKISDFEI